MALAPALAPVVTAFFTILASIFLIRWLRASNAQKAVDVTSSLPESRRRLSEKLASALPDSVILPQNTTSFEQLINACWAKQECEVVPACIVRPLNVEQVCTAITILNAEYEAQREELVKVNEGLFAIRSGGHSPVPGAASIKGGAVIDLSLLREVTPSQDGLTVTIGVGARWKYVYETLEKKGLTVAGGRASDVGVGGLTVAGGLSFFSPQIGLVCSSVISYEVALASGVAVSVSATSNRDLWRALKGGSNNFGVVTSITVPSFPAPRIWSGLLYITASQAPKVLNAFHEYVNRADSEDPKERYDNHAAGPLACFTYKNVLPMLGINIIAVNLVHTNHPEKDAQWPICWTSSSFPSIPRLWSTCKVRSVASAASELSDLNPAGKRQQFATTTIKNDLATLIAVHKASNDAISRICNVRNITWTLVLQPFLPVWASKGGASPLGLDDDTADPLVNVSFTVNWTDSRDDELVKRTTRRVIEEIDRFAEVIGTGHRYRLLNYCAEWQRPFESYGEENLEFLRGVSRSCDPGGLFQRGCTGGFKLGVE